MNSKDKLIEATQLALQGKLNEVYTKEYIGTFDELYDSSWGPAKEVLQHIADLGLEQECMDWLEDFGTEDNPIDRTELNDYIWNNSEDLYDALGLDENGDPIDDENEELDEAKNQGFTSKDFDDLDRYMNNRGVESYCIFSDVEYDMYKDVYGSSVYGSGYLVIDNDSRTYLLTSQTPGSACGKMGKSQLLNKLKELQENGYKEVKTYFSSDILNNKKLSDKRLNTEDKKEESKKVEKNLVEEFTIDTFNNKYKPLYGGSVEVNGNTVTALNITLKGSGMSKKVEATLNGDVLQIDNEFIGITYDGNELKANGQYWFTSDMENNEEFATRVTNAVKTLYNDMKKLQGSKKEEKKLTEDEYTDNLKNAIRDAKGLDEVKHWLIDIEDLVDDLNDRYTDMYSDVRDAIDNLFSGNTPTGCINGLYNAIRDVKKELENIKF